MRTSKYSRELLEPIVESSRSVAQVLRALGLQPTGGNHRMGSARLRLLGISTEHFRGRGWARGERAETDPALARASRRLARPDDEVFVANSPETCGHKLTRRLRRAGWQYACTGCGINAWQGAPLRLHLDHVNGIHNDNRLSNLRFLCPNCHSQTRTYCRSTAGPPRSAQ